VVKLPLETGNGDQRSHVGHTRPQALAWLPKSRTQRRFVIGAGIVGLVVFGIGAIVPFAAGWLDANSLGTLGYFGIFLINFFATAAWFVPIPPVAGQAAIVAGGHTMWKPGVVLAGSLGMTLAESTAYVAGVLGRGFTQEERVRFSGRLGRWSRQSASLVDRYMNRHGFLTLTVLAGVPNPVFEFAGIAAGALQINFWKFLIAVGIGKTARVIALVIIGDAAINFFRR
jgi:membrane protein DedA with SNARE-associated domain